MKKLALIGGAFCLLLAAQHGAYALDATPPAEKAGTTARERTLSHAVRWISVPQIEQSLLGRPPIAVGFDVDDTLLFSSPGYWRGQREYSPGSKDYLDKPAFWEKMNRDWDDFSMPKAVARELIAMHLRRGDTLWFFTHRKATKNEQLTRRLQEYFLIPAAALNDVIFVDDSDGLARQEEKMRQRHIRLFYSDADRDILAAKDAGARAIRVLRASNSGNQPLPRAGAYGEEVIINSDY